MRASHCGTNVAEAMDIFEIHAIRALLRAGIVCGFDPTSRHDDSHDLRQIPYAVAVPLNDSLNRWSAGASSAAMNAREMSSICTIGRHPGGECPGVARPQINRAEAVPRKLGDVTLGHDLRFAVSGHGIERAVSSISRACQFLGKSGPRHLLHKRGSGVKPSL
jgi:hypothetical protein